MPMLMLFPFKIAGLWMIASGRFFTGCMIMLAAKVVSTAVIARIFMTCRPQLMQMVWFARLHAWTLVLRDRIHVWIENQPAWTDAHRFLRHVRMQVRNLFRRSRYVDEQGKTVYRRSALTRWRSRRKARRASAVAAGLAPRATTEREPR